MTKSKNTKRALLASVLSLMLCAVMLVGSTFAWFTDSVTSGKNKIVAGNLDIELEYKDADGHWQPVDTNTSLFLSADNTLWEPGHTEYVQLRIRNAGSLVLMYKFSANVFGDDQGAEEKEYTGQDGKFKLSDYLVFSKTDGAEKVTNRESLWIDDAEKEKELMGNVGLAGIDMQSDPLLPNDNEEITLAVYMPTWVGNAANQLTSAKEAEGAPTIYLGLNLFATQTPHEKDSFGNDYDAAADPDYDPFVEADAAALAKGNAYRNADGTYGKINSSDEPTFLLNLARQGGTATLIRDIGAPARGVSSQQTDYSNKQSMLDLHGHTYTSGGLEVKQSTSPKTNNSSLVIKNGTMVSSINSEDILKSYNAMQAVTLDHVNLKWDNPRAWDADKNNYRGLNLSTDTVGTVFTVNDSVLDCNASFYTNSLDSDPKECAVANLTNTTVNGRLHGAGLTMNVDGCTVNGEVFCNAGSSSKTRINISNSTINGNAFFDAYLFGEQNDVTIKNTVINGNLQTKSVRDNVHITLTDATVTGTLTYTDASYKVSKTLVTIVSGKYGFDPTNYLADGSTANLDAATGMWVVTAG